MKNGEFETRLVNCRDCPKKPGRLCTVYGNGESRLVFDPLPTPQGLLKKEEAYEVRESIEQCLDGLNANGKTQVQL